MRKALVNILLFLLVLVLLTSASWFARPFVAEYVLKKITQRLDQSKNVSFSYQSFEVIGWSTIVFNELSLGIKEETPLFKCKNFQIGIELLPLLEKRLKIDELTIKGADIVFQADSLGSNFLPLLTSRKDTVASKDSTTRSDLGEIANRLLRIAFDALPEHMEVAQTKCYIDGFGVLARFDFSDISIIQDTIKGDISIAERGLSQTIAIHGSIDRENRGIHVDLVHPEGKKLVSPLIKQVSGLHLAFDSLQFHLRKTEYSKSKLLTEGSWKGFNLAMHHDRISGDTVEIRELSMNYSGQLAGRVLRVDSGTTCTINGLPIAMQAALRVSSKPRLSMKVSNAFTAADTFFQALPNGLFASVKGLQAEGALSYRLYLDIDMAKPDSVKFISSLSSKNFKIKQYGKAYIPKLYSSFEYSTQDYPYRKVWVGEENPAFSPLGNISPFLRNSILTAEDASFYHHRGFNEDAFRKSIITNLKAGRFVRGGSTITMQLVKNVFLNRKKTIARKLEETLLVWLIESNRLVSKHRMFEVYLNIIEWAPNVYGIGEASQFYFNKRPSELSLQESIYLSSIVPRPKSFRYSFDGQGHLKPYLSGYYRLLSTIMLRRNLITDQDTIGLQPNVVLSGPARSQLILSDTLPPEEEDEDVIQEIVLPESPLP